MTTYYIDNEHSFIRKIIKGDKCAFAFLYSKYKPRMVAFAFRYLRDNEAAEDIFQDAMLTIWEKRSSLAPVNSLAPLLFMIVRNKIYNLLSSMGHESAFKEKLLSQINEDDSSTENDIVYEDLNNLLEEVVENLPPQQRKIFHMSRSEHKSHAEIAKELSLSVKTVQIHVSSALQTIKKQLSKFAQIHVKLLLLIYFLFN